MTPLALHEIGEILLDCICQQMTDLSGSLAEQGVVYDCPCVTYVSPGAPAWDCCEEHCGHGDGGQLTVHLDEVWPSDSFPARTSPTFPCRPTVWVAAYVVQAVRCVPTVDRTGLGPPRADQLMAAAQRTSVDMTAILTAATCCIPASGAPKKRRVQVDSATVLEPSGGCGGVEVRLLIDAGPLCGCPSDG